MSVAAQVADVSDEESCFLRDADISEIECDAVRAAAKASPAARLLDLKNNCLIRRFAGLSQLFPILESLVLSNNVLGDCSPSMPSSWAAALSSAAPSSLRRLDVTGNGLVAVPWDELATLRLFDLILDNNALTTLGCPSSEGAEGNLLTSSLRGLSVKGNKLASLEGISAIAHHLDSLDARGNMIASIAQLAPLENLRSTLQCIRLEANPCMDGEFCVDTCLRAKLLLEWTTKVVLFNGIQIPDKPRLRKAFCNSSGARNISKGIACPCGLGVRFYDPLMLADAVTEVDDGTESSEEEDAEEREQVAESFKPVEKAKVAGHKRNEKVPENIRGTCELPPDVPPEEKQQEACVVSSVALIKEPLACETVLAEPEQPTLLPKPAPEQPTFLPKKEIMTLKPKVKIVPRRPGIAVSAVPSPRKEKTIAKCSMMAVMPFAEKRGGSSFIRLGVGAGGRGGVRGIGTGGAMPFRKLGQRRVPRPVQRGYDPLEGETWLSEMLKRAKRRGGRR